MSTIQVAAGREKVPAIPSKIAKVWQKFKGVILDKRAAFVIGRLVWLRKFL
jgi:hypothetical protein